MGELNIAIRSFRQIKDFVELATVQPFEVLVGNDRQQINGKSFIGMVSLDHRRPLQVSLKCTQEQFDQFRKDAAQFLV